MRYLLDTDICVEVLRENEPFSFNSEAACCHADLCYELRARPIGERGLVIASIAVANGFPLITGNVREFSRVPGLSVSNWLR